LLFYLPAVVARESLHSRKCTCENGMVLGRGEDTAAEDGPERDAGAAEGVWGCEALVKTCQLSPVFPCVGGSLLLQSEGGGKAHAGGTFRRDGRRRSPPLQKSPVAALLPYNRERCFMKDRINT